MRLRFKSVLAFIFILIIGTSAIGVGYLFYSEVIDTSDIFVDGDITVNFLNGSEFTLDGDATLSFSVTNNSAEEKYYYIQFSDVYADDVDYILTSSDLEITNKLKSDIITNQVAIAGNETVNYTLALNSNQSSEYSGKIKVGVRNNEENTFADVILSNNPVNETALSNIGDNATENEGLLSMEDDLGTSYYFRGNVTNNNVTFAGHNWKIVRINGDGSVKLVLNDIIEEIGSYYDNEFGFASSTALEILNRFYETELVNYSNYIASYKFCNDTVLDTDNATFNAYNRIILNKIPTFVCLGDTTNQKIGLLTIDEVMLAGASTSDNTNYYLYNSDIDTDYYTMSSAKYTNNVYYPFIVTTNGAIDYTTSGELLRGIRPVINIIKTARVTGDGTEDNPYQILEG